MAEPGAVDPRVRQRPAEGVVALRLDRARGALGLLAARRHLIGTAPVDGRRRRRHRVRDRHDRVDGRLDRLGQGGGDAARARGLSARTSAARFAVVDYRDLPARTGSAGDYAAKLDLDFRTDAGAVSGAIQGLELGDGGDTGETMFVGMSTAPSISPGGPASRRSPSCSPTRPPLSPDPTRGLTADAIIQRSLSIDPVEVHVVDIGDATTTELQDVATRTNGGIYRTSPSQAATQIAAAIDVSLKRPYAWAAGPYVGPRRPDVHAGRARLLRDHIRHRHATTGT